MYKDFEDMVECEKYVIVYMLEEIKLVMIVLQLLHGSQSTN